MQFLAMDHGVNVDQQLIATHLSEDVRRVWELYAEGTIRAMYQRGDNPFAVLILECETLEVATEKIATIPFVRFGVTAFDIIPIGPFTGLTALFQKS